MPVLVNKGDNPSAAAWLLFTSRDQLAELAAAIRESEAEAGVVSADPGNARPKELVDVTLTMVMATDESPDAEPTASSVQMGVTTSDSAARYLKPREVDGQPWTLNLPGLPDLAKTIDMVLENEGARCVVWYMDAARVLRMAPAKEAKPMAGNILKVKL